MSTTELFPTLSETAKTLAGTTGEVNPERLELLNGLADYIRSRTETKTDCNLNMICTHNSRRSHLTQMMAALAARYYGIDGVYTYSGGTEATAVHPNTINALLDLGFVVDALDETSNPRLKVKLASGDEGIVIFSKKYGDDPNPKENFAAVMTCSDADENCPIVYGCDKRIALTYADPKESDGTGKEKDVYYGRALEIGREMFWAFSKVQGATS